MNATAEAASGWWISEASGDVLFVQTHKKNVGTDGVTRDEGVWLYNASGPVECRPFPEFAWKNLPLSQRKIVLEQAKETTISHINKAIRFYQLNKYEVKGTTAAIVIEKVDELDRDDSISGAVSVSRTGDFLIFSGKAIAPQWIDAMTSKDSILVLSHLKKVVSRRYDRAISIIANWDHLVKSSQSQDSTTSVPSI